MAWQRLSARNGDTPEETLFEGVPAHLRTPLTEWVRARFGWFSYGGLSQNLMLKVGTALRLPLRQSESVSLSNEIVAFMQRDDDVFLDVLDFLLYEEHEGKQELHEVLEVGGSAWALNADGTGLERRVPETAKAAADSATSGNASYSAELREAWGRVFGRNPDPSDAWDHAIKALEELLIPIVVPGKPKSNLGTVAGELANSSHKWHIDLDSSGSRDAAETLSDMLRLVWPNPDRHGGGADRRAPSQEEAESAVHLSVAIVEMCRDGRLVKR